MKGKPTEEKVLQTNENVTPIMTNASDAVHITWTRNEHIDDRHMHTLNIEETKIMHYVLITCTLDGTSKHYCGPVKLGW